ncbi:lysine N(6)-hydroxylase/L-ornithine N(5)-oxygenase family protein [Xanthobacter autotrophicus]|uniref:lysine N(6)-hydroxylase/L-ornithine N(5)-oxygenase family protein n=1 Tax=Xanthobacter TaxID=279 RepID=UPI0024AB6D8A|nr:lysine N(6)-hydroxylase/L-ornithine N(5)-oxygenase family protein [Xanthobacter autotrophicus]MDI4664954.1 lysine N(6)-hydroxylase/L-ornithine N(5)-oxygenase family protein [Xanthobacter autotrophicus]
MTYSENRLSSAALRSAGPKPDGEERGQDKIHDLIGVGFGPSNLAIAIALEGMGAPGLCAHFIEKQQSFVWHGGMLLPGSDMQISFLKDLALQRDPSSPFTFLAYLHENGRLMDFINLKTFFPSRIEFNDYLRWAAGKFNACVSYGEEVVALEPEVSGGSVDVVRVISRAADGRARVRRTRNLALATGGTLRVPELFAPFRNVPRIFHSAAYLSNIDSFDFGCHPAPRIAVVGAAQSAAEIFLDLTARFPHGRVDMIVRGHALRPSDDTPFVNEIFNPEFTDFIFRQSEPRRRALIADFKSTNYSVVDADLIARIYDVLYQQKVTGDKRHQVRRLTEVTWVGEADGAVVLDLAVGPDGEEARAFYDAVVLATGYVRDGGRALLGGLEPYVAIGAVGRDYRLATAPEFRPAVFIQGTNEGTHGLSDTLLSVLATRGQEIAEAVVAAHAAPGAALASPMLRQLGRV